MFPFTNIKAAFNIDRWRRGGIRVTEIGGAHGEKPWPFDYRKAVEQCQSWVFRCAMGNAQAAASIPLKLYIRKLNAQQLKSRGLKHGCVWQTRPVSRKQLKWLRGEHADHRPCDAVRIKAMQFGDDFEEVVDAHPVIDVLRRANSQWNGYNLAVFRFLSQELTGNAYLHPIISKETGSPIELWPMLPQWMWVVPGREDGDPFITEYRYGQFKAQAQSFEPDEVLHFRYPSMMNLWYGMGKVEAAWTVLGLHNSERTMQKALFDNHARPDALINIEGAVDDQIERFDSKLKSLFRGARNAGQMLVTGGKVSYTPLAFPPKQLGSTEGIIEEIAGVFGYPVTKLKANDPNRSNAETGDAGWMKDTIAPMLVQDEEALNQNGFLGLFANGAIVDDAVLAYDDPVPQNQTFDLERRTRFTAGGIMTLNEARAEDGMEPVEGGDVARVNGVPLDLLGQQPASDPFGGLLSGFAAPKPQAALPAPIDLRVIQDRDDKMWEPKPPANTKTISQFEQLYTPAAHVHCKALDNDDAREGEPESPAIRFMRALAAALDDAQSQIVAVIGAGKALSKLTTKRLTDQQMQRIEDIIKALGPQVQALSKTAMKEIIAIAARHALEELNADPERFDIDNPRIVRLIEQHTLKLAGAVSQHTLGRVTQSLAEGVGKGESTSQLAARVRDSGQFSPQRAEAIARSESARAFIEGRIESWDQSGVVAGKQWELASGACPICETISKEFNNKTIGLRDAFFKQGESLKLPDGATFVFDYSDIRGAPAHVNCRCNIIPIMVRET